ncbi:hypothetical protein J3R30DRAFT_1614805 [Lentinula aciculospora]|uniref:Uncharacterized protein n=1 Tax=Lentinula aciculospora TaxID=153920 RepID=A0A9W8ZWU4_9AGAR|nr:hypothetical protein J3R30DRAFT_1614805 [Lentinula aciculospora]
MDGIHCFLQGKCWRVQKQVLFFRHALNCWSDTSRFSENNLLHIIPLVMHFSFVHLAFPLIFVVYAVPLVYDNAMISRNSIAMDNLGQRDESALLRVSSNPNSGAASLSPGKDIPNRVGQYMSEWVPSIKIRFLNEDGEVARGSRSDKADSEKDCFSYTPASPGSSRILHRHWARSRLRRRVQEFIGTYKTMYQSGLRIECLNDYPFDDDERDFSFKFNEGPGNPRWVSITSGGGGIVRKESESGALLFQTPTTTR